MLGVVLQMWCDTSLSDDCFKSPLYACLIGSGMAGGRPSGLSQFIHPWQKWKPHGVLFYDFSCGGDSMVASCGKVVRLIYVSSMHVLGVEPPYHGDW